MRVLMITQLPVDGSINGISGNLRYHALGLGESVAIPLCLDESGCCEGDFDAVAEPECLHYPKR